MSSAPAPFRFVRMMDYHRTDQRAHRRYAISLSVEYRLINDGRVGRWGSGQTLNVSTGGVYFECLDSLPVAGAIELVISWPFLLEGVCPLKLVMRGYVVRMDGPNIAVHAHRHEFRTAGAKSSCIPSVNRGLIMAR
jgi:hypothetical protein